MHDVLIWRLLPLAIWYCQHKSNQHPGSGKGNAETFTPLSVLSI